MNGHIPATAVAAGVKVTRTGRVNLFGQYFQSHQAAVVIHAFIGGRLDEGAAECDTL